jgi:hypothetical protein
MSKIDLCHGECYQKVTHFTHLLQHCREKKLTPSKKPPTRFFWANFED